MEPHIQELSRNYVAMNNDNRKDYVECAEKVVKFLLDHSKQKDPNEFGKIYRRFLPVGSYYDGARVKEATEFDFNVILNLGCLDFVIDRNNEPGGFVKLRIDKNKRKPTPGIEKLINRWTNDKGYIVSQRLKSYMESISHDWRDVSLSSLNIPGQPRVIKSGPAVTLVLQLPSIEDISIDLVPVIEIDIPPPKAYRWGEPFDGHWFLVPKSYKYFAAQDESWRPSFPLQERAWLAKGKIKHVLRLVKRVRDTLEFNAISSYFIKTLFLWKKFDKELDWEKNSLSYLFFFMLNVLRQCLEHHSIPNFWCDANLLENIKRATTANWACQLQRLLSRLEMSIEKAGDQNREEMRQILTSLFVVPSGAPA